MEKDLVSGLFHQLIVINARSFEAEFYDVAYHSLASALACARELEDEKLLSEVSSIATEEIGIIDKLHPEYEHSTSSAKRRHQASSIFTLLSTQAKTIIKMQNTNPLVESKKSSGMM